jgi:hypothetical protein
LHTKLAENQQKLSDRQILPGRIASQTNRYSWKISNRKVWRISSLGSAKYFHGIECVSKDLKFSACIENWVAKQYANGSLWTLTRNHVCLLEPLVQSVAR